MKAVAEIAPPAPDGKRPFWSVMIPTYRPDREYLARTLESVLTEDPGPERMQIAIVDDPSGDDVAERIGGRAAGRVEVHRHAARRGMARNWNDCIRLARGRWIHLLHQDDLVLPGFYAKLERAIAARDDLGAAVVQHYLIDDRGRRRCRMSQYPARAPGVIDDWVEWVFVQLAFQTPAVVVKRAVYEELGGFREDLPYALDWDMWKRIAARHPLWFDPEPLAAYRRHEEGASAAFFRSGENMAAVRRSIEISRAYLPPAERESMAARASAHYARDAVDAGLHALFARRDPRTAWRQTIEARRFRSPTRFSRLVAERLLAAISRWREDRAAR